MKFFTNLLKVLVVLGGFFVAFGLLVAKIEEKALASVPKKRACEDAVCAVDQCMPY